MLIRATRSVADQGVPQKITESDGTAATTASVNSRANFRPDNDKLSDGTEDDIEPCVDVYRCRVSPSPCHGC